MTEDYKWKKNLSIGIKREGKKKERVHSSNMIMVVQTVEQNCEAGKGPFQIGKITCTIRSYCIFTTGHWCLRTLNFLFVIVQAWAIIMLGLLSLFL